MLDKILRCLKLDTRVCLYSTLYKTSIEGYPDEILKDLRYTQIKCRYDDDNDLSIYTLGRILRIDYLC